MRPLLGSRYRIGGNGWWHVAANVPILTSDDIEVVDIDEVYTTIEVRRDGVLLGSRPIYHTMFPQDFDQVR